MLEKLVIQNYAIIEALEIDFSVKLNVITGETGAGKSIIVGALGLILGERADSGSLVNKEKKCVVEGIFRTAKKEVAEFLKENELDTGEDLVLRREIGINGKSRGFINDSPVNLQQLQELSFLLVDLHQQFDTLSLSETGFQRDVLDALAGQFEQVEEYRLIFHEWQELKKETESLKTQQQQFEKEADYNRFQFTELETAGFREDELEEIDAELNRLNNSEEIKAALNKAYFTLQESETPVVNQLKVLVNQLNAYSHYHTGLPDLLQRLQSAQIELQDIAGELERISNQVTHDPERMEQLTERLSLGYKLQKKHGVSSTRELLAIQSQLEEKLQAVLDIDDAIRQKEKELSGKKEQVTRLATQISGNRRQQIKPLEKNVNKLLAQVGMPNALFKVKHSELMGPGQQGIDDIDFLFDANKSGQFQPVRKVASGGELSRLMLCIKSLVARSIDLPTMIFDEIDTGISGEAARQVGIIMKDLASKRQVISITHQPQIAGKADAHYFVYKEIVNDKVKTNIRRLTMEERITTIARMLSGEKPTAAAIANAREMVGN